MARMWYLAGDKSSAAAQPTRFVAAPASGMRRPQPLVATVYRGKGRHCNWGVERSRRRRWPCRRACWPPPCISCRESGCSNERGIAGRGKRRHRWLREEDRRPLLDGISIYCVHGSSGRRARIVCRQLCPQEACMVKQTLKELTCSAEAWFYRFQSWFGGFHRSRCGGTLGRAGPRSTSAAPRQAGHCICSTRSGTQRAGCHAAPRAPSPGRPATSRHRRPLHRTARDASQRTRGLQCSWRPDAP
jgi:hypothetical protein